MGTFMSRRIVGLSILLLLQSIGFAQLKETYSKGMAELSNGQQLTGYLKEDDLSNMAKHVNFKSSLEQKAAITYDNSQLRMFRFESGDVFEALRFAVNNGTEEINAFAKLLVRGKTSLYKTAYKSEVVYVVRKEDKLQVLQDDRLLPGTTEVTTYHYKDNLLQIVNGFLPANMSLEGIGFSEKDFINIVSGYNSSLGSPSETISAKQKAVHFIIATIGGGLIEKNNKELFVQGIYRTYLPGVSKGTSLNVGLNFFTSKYSETVGFGLYEKKHDYTSKLLSLPVSLQQNLLNKGIRPFLTAGVCVGYSDVKNEEGTSVMRKGFSDNFGAGILYGGGVEADLFKGLMLKAEYRQEVYAHLLLVGISFNVSSLIR